MIVGVVGSRNINDREYVFRKLDDFILKGDRIVSGGAIGVDSYAEEYADDHHLDKMIFNPLSDMTFDYLRRNILIAKYIDILLAFPSKESRGTWHTIRKAKEMGKRVVVFDKYL